MMERGEYRKSMELAAAALALDPDNLDARLVRARTLIEGKRYVEVIEEARAVLRADPDNWVAHMLIAIAGKYGVPSVDASRHLAAVEGLVPDTADAFYLRGNLADSHGEAIEWLDRALELDPGHLLALRQRAYRHGSLKNLPAAIQAELTAFTDAKEAEISHRQERLALMRKDLSQQSLSLSSEKRAMQEKQIQPS